MHSNEKPHRCGGYRRAWPGFEIDDSEPQVHAWREPRGPRSLAAVPVGAGGRRQGIAGLQNDADHPPAHQAPPFVEGTARPAEPGRGAGGCRWAAAGPGRASRSTTPSRRFTHGRNREARVACGTWPRCRWAAAGLGRASRSTTPSRRLACGDLAVGPPPTGTHSPTTTSTHNATRPRPVSRPRPRRAQSVPLRTTALRRKVPLSKAAPPAIRRSCPRGPRPRRGQPRGGRRGRGTGSRTRS